MSIFGPGTPDSIEEFAADGIEVTTDPKTGAIWFTSTAQPVSIARRLQDDDRQKGDSVATVPARSIQPLGEQIIIRTIPVDSVGSIIVPDSAKSITQMGAKGADDAVHYVEAEVIAVGPGKRGKGDPALLKELADALDRVTNHDHGAVEGTASLIERARKPLARIKPLVKPGDRILYHPAVQKFDRKVEGLGEGEFYIIREDSVLAVIER